MILSTATGQGHNSAAIAVKEYLNKHGADAVVEDALTCNNNKTSNRASKLYSSVTTHAPMLFGAVYNIGAVVSKSNMISPVYISNSIHSDKLFNKIDEYKPNAIVCCHTFPAETVTKLKKTGKISIPTVDIATDYTCSPFWEDADMDYYIIPHKLLVDEFVKCGLDKNKILPFGIPVKHKFRVKTDKELARKAFGFSAKHVFAIMGGSMGFGKIERITTKLLNCDNDCEIAVVCGFNDKLYESLKNKTRIKAFKFIDNVNVLMDACDVLMTKPGGLSSTEAINKNVPLILTSPIPGCESKNQQFLSRLGVACSANTPDEIVINAEQLLNNEKKRNKMLSLQKEFSKIDSQKEIGELILSF